MDVGGVERLRQVLVERARRAALTAEAQQKLDDIKAKVASTFVFTGDRRHAVRVSDVAKAIGLNRKSRSPKQWWSLRQAIRELGGELLRPANIKIVRGCHLRGLTHEQAVYAGVAARKSKGRLKLKVPE